MNPEKPKQERDKSEENQELIIEENQKLREKNRRLRKKIQELKLKIETLEDDLIHDQLTGLKTRKYFLENAKREINALSRAESERRRDVGPKNISYLFCDIDSFKEINDTYGHFLGDEILKDVSRLLQGSVRGTDTVCRWGGEEIVIDLIGANEENARNKAERLRKIIEESVAEKYINNPRYKDLKITLSIGIAAYKKGITVEELVRQSDLAMFLAKKEGKNCVRTFSQVLERRKSKINES